MPNAERAEKARGGASAPGHGIDPAVLPAVNMPTPGGLTYEIRVLRGVAAKADIVGLAMVEYAPKRDDRHLMSELEAARIAAVTMGLVL